MRTPTNREPASAGSLDPAGVPFLLRGALSESGNRIRARLGRLHARLASPPVRIMEGLFGALDHRVLVALCQARVPDVLNGPMHPVELARIVGATGEGDLDQLERLLRFASTRGWVRIDRLGRVHPTDVTAHLREDHPGGWRAWVELLGGDEVVATIASIRVAGGIADPFAAANGVGFLTWMAEHPDRWATFNKAMAATAWMHGVALADAVDWTDIHHVCDVGGGNGELARTLVDLLAHIDATVFDLPDVVARVPGHARVRAVGGDAFEEVPPGFDVYLLVNMLHDWNDADAARLLARVATAAGSTGRVLVVEGDRQTIPQASLSVSSDVLMSALTGAGRARDGAELAALADACGLDHTRTLRLVSGDVAHELRPRRS